jgi:hypothetical protein
VEATVSPNDPALAFTVADAAPPARSRFLSSARNRRSISPTSADMAREYRWAPDMIMILSMGVGFDKNVGSEVLVPNRARKQCGHDCKKQKRYLMSWL